uniref:Core shell protein Gag P30 domain-containing protein n=1 Tax=Canis lupus familiaris TaxID=9615 RepID=A0A8C0PQ94_CANLF
MIENPPLWLKPFLPPKAGPTEILALRKAEKETDSMPQAPLYPVFQDSSPEDLILPPPCRAPPPPSAPPLETPGAAEGASPLPDEGVPVHGPAAGTRGGTLWSATPPNAGPADSTALPLRAMGPPDETGEQLMLYWPFSTSDLYNWKTQNAKFSDNLSDYPRDLIGLLNTVLFTHQPTWDDSRQLLQVLFTTEERERIQVEARKSVLGEDRQPTQNPDLINAAFPLSRPTWGYSSPEGKERLRVHSRGQTLGAGLQAAARKPPNLAKVCDVRQGKDESPAAFLERVIEASRQCTPMNPEAPETKAAIMAFVNQAAPNIKKKLQSRETGREELAGLGDNSRMSL